MSFADTIKRMRTAKDLAKLNKSANVEEAVAAYNDMSEQVNFLGKNMSLANFACEIVSDIVFAAGEEKIIKHGLGIVPKYRVILRQEGNGVISDIPSAWDTKSIKLKNNGAVKVTATIWIMRE